MIRILFFIESLEGGGAEKVLRDLVNHMDRAKFDITVQTLWPCDAAKYLAPWVRYRSMYTSKNKVHQLRCRAEAGSGLAYRLHIKDDYDIECAYLEMGSTKIMASSTNKRAKKLAWVHCDLSKAIENPDVFVEKTTPWYAKFDQIVCVSQTAKDSFDKIFDHRFDSTVLYNVIDDAAIRKKAVVPLQYERKKQRLTVLSVGRLTYPKNYLRLLRTHKQLLDEGLDHDLWILGEGEDRPKLEQFIAENQLSDTVWMPGFVENPYPYMQEADVLTCSSVYEGFSTFITEGMILGKPVVTTDVSGMREILGNSEYGLIVENEDRAYLDGVRRMLSDAAVRKQYAASALKRGNEFSAAELTKKTEQFFASLLGVTI